LPLANEPWTIAGLMPKERLVGLSVLRPVNSFHISTFPE
jgi:hypothetical protein